MNIQKISIGIVLYKGEKYLEKSISSLLNQEISGKFEYEILLRDHSPALESTKYIQKKFPEISQQKNIRFFSGENIWHSGGHNALIKEMADNSEGYLCASYDMWYPENFLENLRKGIDENPEISVFAPKLKQWNFEKNKFSNVIDSCGIGLKKNHHFFDIGQGEEDEISGKFSEKKEIFGASGALFFAKKSALEHIKYVSEISGKAEYFDENIHYKNDVDLAYRFFLAGERCLFLPQSEVFHHRQLGNKTAENSFFQKILSNWKDKSFAQKDSSFLGQLIVIRKIFWAQNFSTKISILWYLFLSSGLALVTHPSLLRNYWKIFTNPLAKEIQKKRDDMQKKIIKNSRQNNIF